MRKRWSWRLCGIIFVVLLVTALSGLSYAQGVAQEKKEAVAQQPQAGEEQAQEKFVEEVTVTAQKRTEDVQEVPLAMTALVGQDLSLITSGGPDVRFLSARVPSLMLESSFGRAFPRFYMRGLGNTDFDLNASQPVSMVVDEVVLENPIVKGMPLFDLDRIEILRGPQGTLFGRNTPAGVIKFETKKPAQEFDANFRLSYGSFNTIDLNGGVGGALTDTVSARFSALYQSRSDWVDNDNPFHPKKDALGGYDTTAYRLQFLFEPNSAFSALLNVHGWDLDGTARIFRANIIQPGTNKLTDWFKQDVVYQDGLNKQEMSAMGALLRFDYNFGPATLTSLTGFESIDDMYSRGDIDGGYGAVFLGEGNYGPGMIPFASESADGIPSLDQITQEIRIASNSAGNLNWLTGVFYFSEDLKVDSFGYDSLSPGNPEDGYAFQKQDATSYALFGSINYRPEEKWDIRAGLRYSKDNKDFEAQRVRVPFIQNLLYGVLPSVLIKKSVDGSNVSGDISATYKVNDEVNVFSRLATGYRAPSIQGRILWCADIDGTNPATNCVTTADQEKITSFEVGVKSILADRRLRMNLTAYIYQMKGQQLTAVGGQFNTATLLNADKTDGHGFEADIEYIPSPNYWATIGLSWNPTKINDPTLTVAACGGGCTITNPRTSTGLVLIDGNPLPHAPEWIFNGILNFQTDPVSKGFFGAFDWAYYSKKYFFLYESKEFNGDGLECGLRLGYGFGAGKYEVALFGRNIFDAKIVEGGIDFDNLTGYTNEPRTYGVEFVTRF